MINFITTYRIPFPRTDRLCQIMVIAEFVFYGFLKVSVIIFFTYRYKVVNDAYFSKGSSFDFTLLVYPLLVLVAGAYLTSTTGLFVLVPLYLYLVVALVIACLPSVYVFV